VRSAEGSISKCSPAFHVELRSAQLAAQEARILASTSLRAECAALKIWGRHHFQRHAKHRNAATARGNT
jgi:hypothetical protein